MGKIKLIYFNARGRAELSRLIMAQAGQEYEDVRIQKEEWPEMKPNMPGGQLPVLEIDGIKIGQSITIARYLANKFHLAGTTDIEKAQADMILDCIQDIGNELLRAKFQQKEEIKKELSEKITTQSMPSFLNNLTKILEQNGGKYMVGNEVTWADIAMAGMMAFISQHNPDVINKFKALGDLSTKVNNLPNIKAWLENRPKTEM